jgi:hypothetical protein
MQRRCTASDTKTPAPSWRDRVKVHPDADRFPMMSDDELKVLGADIRENGLRNGITLWTPVQGTEGGLKRNESLKHWFARTETPIYQLDGRNRVAAVERENAKHPDREESGVDDLLPFTGELFEFEGIQHDDDLPKAKLLWGDVDPFLYVISANLHRRHLSLEDREGIAAEVLKKRPELSNRQVAEQVKLSHPKVGKIRKHLEEAGDVETVSTRTDTAGRAQPAHKAKPKPPATPAPAPQPAAPQAVEPGAPAPAKPAPEPLKLEPDLPEMSKAETKVVHELIQRVKMLNHRQWRALWDWAVGRNEEMGGE